jgi:PAS domain S-box-containing protein
MFEFFGRLFDSAGFVPRKDCGDWTPGLLWLHVGSDLFIWLAYLSIPLVLVYFLRKQRKLPFPWLIGLFAVLILACGFTHFLDALMFEKPLYRLAGLVKFLTAVVSWATVVALIAAVPRVTAAVAALPGVSADTAQHVAVSGRKPDRRLDYIVAILAAVLAILVRGALDPVLRTDQVFVVSLLAVVFVSWQYGFGPGVVCLVVSMLGFVFFFVSSPKYSLAVVGLDNQMAIALFFFCGVACCGLGEAQRYARKRERRALAESLEKRDALEREVTRRKVIEQDLRQREDALRDSEGYLRSVLDHSPDCVKVLSVDGRLMEMNRPGLCLMEIDDFAPLVGADWAALWPDHERAVRAAVAQAATGTVARFQGPAATAKGTMKFWDVQVAPVPGPDGTPTRLVSVSRDITDQRRTEEAVRHSEATLRAFYDNSPLNMGIVELTYDGDIRHVYDNAAACRFFGVPTGDTAGKLASALGATADTIEKWRKHYRQSAATGKAVQFDHTYDAADGKRWLAVTVSAIPTPTGTPTRYCYVAEDVTERQRAEREVRLSESRFRTLATAVPQVVWVTQPDGGREYHNAKWYAYTGLTPEQSNGWNWLDILHPDDRAESEAKWRHSIATGEEYEVARRIRGADGEYRWFLGRALPQTDEAGTIVRWFGTCTDIHDAKVTEEQVRALNDELAARMGELQSILDAAPAAIWIARDPDCLDVTGNRTSFELLRTPATENVSASVDPEARRFREYRDGTPIPPDELPLQVSARTGRPQDNVELELRFDDGGVKYVYGNTAPLLDAAGKLRGALGVFIDVTEQKKTAAALRERENEFRVMAESIPQLAWMTRPDGHIFWYNQRWYDYTGTTFEQMEGWGWQSIHDPAELPRVVEKFKAHIAAGEPWEDTFPLRRHDGQMRWHLSRALPIKDAEGRVVRWFGTNTDITDQRDAAEKLRASEERFRTLTEAVPNIVWNSDADGKASYFNTRWHEYTGIDVTEARAHGWLSAVHPDDADRVKAAWRDTVAGGAGGGGRRFAEEFRLRHAGTDEYRWFLSVAAPLRRPDGTIDQWIGSMADIHEQKTAAERITASAERFRLLTEAVPQMVWTADPRGEVTFFNRRWDEFTGLPVVNRDAPGWAAVIHPDDSTKVNTSWQLATAQAADHYTQEFRLRRAADGEYRWMLSNAVPLRTPAGEVVEWVGSLTDIHDQKSAAENLENTVRDRTAQLQETNAALLDEIAVRTRAEERVEATARELRRSNEELEQFAYIASHDLQEPLRKIQSFGDLLKTKYREQLPAGGKEYADKMLNSAARMRRLIDDLLSLSRITSQGKAYTRADLTDLAEQVKADFDLRLEATGGTIDIGPLPAVDADPPQIRQLFQNLFSNALKFRKPGVAPEIRVRGESSDDGTARITVEDNGIGFEEKYSARIFQVFQRLHGRDEYEGTGVGLAICQKIVERHGGTITAHGRPGDGATFAVALPISQPIKDPPGDDPHQPDA